MDCCFANLFLLSDEECKPMPCCVEEEALLHPFCTLVAVTNFSFIFISERRMSSEEVSWFLTGTFSLPYWCLAAEELGRGFRAIVFSLLYSLVESTYSLLPSTCSEGFVVYVLCAAFSVIAHQPIYFKVDHVCWLSYSVHPLMAFLHLGL